MDKASSFGQPFRPSNGSHGDVFMGEWCEQCRKFGTDDNPCEVLNLMMLFGTDHESYPKEIIKDDSTASGGRCTAFADPSAPKKPYRCRETQDLFGEAL